MTTEQLAKGNKIASDLEIARNALACAEKLTHTCADWSASIRHLSYEDAKSVKDMILRSIRRKVSALEVQLHTV